MVTFIGYFYFMQIFMTLCSNLNSVMSNYVYSAFKSEARGNDLYFQVTGDVFNFELVFPSMQVLTVDWFSLGWLMLVVLARHQHILQMFSTAARLDLEFCKSWDQTQ